MRPAESPRNRAGRSQAHFSFPWPPYLHLHLLLPVVFAKDGRARSYFSMVTTVGTPQDITLQELRVESFFPT